MNNLLSYCGLVDARISASEKDLPVMLNQKFFYFDEKTVFVKNQFVKLSFVLYIQVLKEYMYEWYLGKH